MSRNETPYPLGALLPNGRNETARTPPVGGSSYRAPVKPDPGPSQTERIGLDILGFLAGLGHRVRDFMPRVRDFGTEWADRIRFHWQRGGASGRVWAVVLSLTGFAMLIAFGYLMMMLIPVLLLAAFIAFILTAMGRRY